MAKTETVEILIIPTVKPFLKLQTN